MHLYILMWFIVVACLMTGLMYLALGYLVARGLLNLSPFLGGRPWFGVDRKWRQIIAILFWPLVILALLGAVILDIVIDAVRKLYRSTVTHS